jgi:propanol-preferring alcohol dehydrogenase
MDTPAYTAYELTAPGRPLQQALRRAQAPGPGQVALSVSACGVCRTDLHLVDGDLAHPGRPVVPGHEVVGRVAELGEGVSGLAVGDRVGVPWLGWTCGSCEHCRAGRENLCPHAKFTGWQLDGGYAGQVVADARYVFRLPARYRDDEAAPLLCAGLIGYRAYAMAGDAPRLGIYGFGAAAHLIAQVAVAQQREVDALPALLDAAILFAPVGALVPVALRAVRAGGTVVCAGIHMSDIPSFPYAILWGERRLLSVANLTRADGDAFMKLADEIALRVHTVPYALEDANRALDDLRAGRFAGAAVLHPPPA